MIQRPLLPKSIKPPFAKKYQASSKKTIEAATTCKNVHYKYDHVDIVSGRNLRLGGLAKGRSHVSPGGTNAAVCSEKKFIYLELLFDVQKGHLHLEVLLHVQRKKVNTEAIV